MRSKIRSSLLIVALLALACGCGSLDKSGVYGGDKALYAADETLDISYTTLHQFVLWEQANRAALAGTPEIKQFADKIRTEAPQAFHSAVALRDAYKANPTSANMTAFQRALTVVHELMTQATIYFVRAPADTTPIK